MGHAIMYKSITGIMPKINFTGKKISIDTSNLSNEQHHKIAAAGLFVGAIPIGYYGIIGMPEFFFTILIIYIVGSAHDLKQLREWRVGHDD